MNRPVRDPYAGWCERRTLSEQSGKAVYSIMPSPFFSVVFVRCHFVSVLVCWLGGSFAVFSLALCDWKNCKCATKCVGNLFR